MPVRTKQGHESVEIPLKNGNVRIAKQVVASDFHNDKGVRFGDSLRLDDSAFHGCPGFCQIDDQQVRLIFQHHRPTALSCPHSRTNGVAKDIDRGSVRNRQFRKPAVWQLCDAESQGGRKKHDARHELTSL